MKTTKEQRKFALYDRIKNLGFEIHEVTEIICIERTLHRWAEAECNGAIERPDERRAGNLACKPLRVIRHASGKSMETRYPIADREAGALRRLKTILDARNIREEGTGRMAELAQDHVFAYHQTDPRGCALYLITRAQLGKDSIESAYNRGLAICY